MENRQKMVRGLAQPYNMISSLPENVIEMIMMYLSTRDAVRTSILSRKWRYRWTKLPQLIIDKMFWDKFTAETISETLGRMILSNVLYQILLLHEGHIKKLIFSVPGLEICSEIDNLIFFLSRNGLEDLTLEIWTGEYLLPSSFFKCQQLSHLSLHSCWVESPPDFKGFSRLIMLKLCKVTISIEAIESILSNSPLLEVLDLDIWSDFLNPEDAVEKMSIGKDFTSNILNFFRGIPLLQKMHLAYALVESLVGGGVPRRLPNTLVYLKDLKLSNTMLNDSDDMSFILCLMRNSPNIKCVHLQIYMKVASHTNAVLEILKEEAESGIMFNELEEVKLENVTGTIPETEFIKLILAKSPNLKTVLVQNHRMKTSVVGFKILKELTKYRRASREAEVIYEEGEDS